MSDLHDPRGLAPAWILLLGVTSCVSVGCGRISSEEASSVSGVVRVAVEGEDLGVVDEPVDQPGAADTSAEAVQVYRHLAETNATRHEPDLALALALAHIAADLRVLGHRGDALTVAAEAVDRSQRLVGDDPTVHGNTLTPTPHASMAPG